MLKRFYLLTILLVLLSSCRPKTPVVYPTQTATMKPAEEIVSTRSPSTTEFGSMEPLNIENIDHLEQVARFGDGYIQDIAISPDQSTMAVFIGENIDIYDTETFDLKQSIVTAKYIKNSSDIRKSEWKILTFTSDSSKLIVSNGQRIIFWDITENKILSYFSSLIPEWDVVDIALSPKEDRVVVTTMGSSSRCDGRDMNFALYDLDGRLIFDRYTCADYSKNFYRFTSDDKVLFIFASIMTSIYPTQTMLIDGLSGEILEQTQAEYLDYEQPIPNQELLYDISPDGKLLAFATYNRAGEKLSVRTKLVHFETKKIIHEQDGMVEFIVDQGEINWQTVSNNQPSLEKEMNICNINNSHILDEYNLLLSRSEQAVFAVMHGGKIKSIELWNISNCEIKRTISYSAANSVLFSADGRLLGGTDGYHAYIWDVQTGKLLFMVPGKPFESPRDVIRFNAESSRFLVSSYGWDNYNPGQPYRTYTISIFDVKTGQLLQELKPDTDFLKNIIATPEKDLIIAQDSTNRQVWNIETGQKLAVLPDGPFVFDVQTGYIWIALQQKNDAQSIHKIILYNYRTGEQVRELSQGTIHWIRNIYLDSNGTKLLAHLFLGQGKENGDAIVIMDIENNGKRLLNYRLPWGDFEMSTYGDSFAIHDSNGNINIWDYDSHSPELTFWGDHRNQKVSDRYKFAKDKDDEYAMLEIPNWIDMFFFNKNILMTKGTSLRFWDTRSGDLLTELEPDYSINSLSFSPDGSLIAVVSNDGIVRLWGVPNEP